MATTPSLCHSLALAQRQATASWLRTPGRSSGAAQGVLLQHWFVVHYGDRNFMQRGISASAVAFGNNTFRQGRERGRCEIHCLLI